MAIIECARQPDTVLSAGAHAWRAEGLALSCSFIMPGVSVSVRGEEVVLTRDEALVLAEMLRCMACDG